MDEPAEGTLRTVTRSYRRDLGATWWAALVVVTVVLGLIGRGSSGFWSVFLWSIVGFVLGSLVSLYVAGRVVPARFDDQLAAPSRPPEGGRDPGTDGRAGGHS
ncbi:hypothetical protein [Terrabacter sp. NPDC080008]|uniref:hypothetical protein n=1 Tax=Terrabacter sp. NPDC080008 TaxID=3155176 RepID=UPI00344C305F